MRRKSRKLRSATILTTVLFLAVTPLSAQRSLRARATGSGGPMTPEQASYDVRHYDLSLRIDPEERFISGTLVLRATIVFPTHRIVLDLDTPLTAEQARLLPDDTELEMDRRDGKLWVFLPGTLQPGEEIRLAVDYRGHPRVAPAPPWVGGFSWERTPGGGHWIAVSCQGDGADIWWPAKDHPADEADSMDLHITVPLPLVVATNGTQTSVESNDDGTRTFNWHVANPINNYAVSINAAPYRTIERTYQSVTGETVPMTFWVLPEHYEKGLVLMEEIPQHLRFLEETLGPYPFRNEKYGVAETPYLGMEHQTIIAYGHDFTKTRFGFDWLHFHEAAHEWWGNLVTAGDWNDYWIHEGFTSYMEGLYSEALNGTEGLHDFMSSIRPRLRNLQPVAPRDSQTTVEKYFVPPDYTASDGDVNFKGAWIVHTLRYLIGDPAFFHLLRRLTYPDPSLESTLDGTQCHFKSTRDVRVSAERVAGVDLGWFFEIYLRQEALPRLVSKLNNGILELEWKAPDGLPFPMPIEVQIGNDLLRINMDEGRATIPVPKGESPRIDPRQWILRANDGGH